MATKRTLNFILILFSCKKESFNIQNLNGNKFTPHFTLTNKLYHKNTMRECTRNGFHYRLDISDYMQHAIYFGLQNDTDFDREFLYSLIKKDAVVLDIGANIGETTLHFARLASNGIVFGFEPVPYVFDFFQNNVRLNNKKIDLIKIDVEGFEPFVLEGASNSILKYRPKMYVEINHDHLQRNNFSNTDLLFIIQNLGYDLFIVNGKNINSITNLNEIPKEVFELYATPKN